MAAPIYVPGRRILCTAADCAPEFHVRGWFPPEPSLTWINGMEGTLCFSIRRPETGYVFTAEVEPFTAAGMQTLEVFFNCFRVAFFEVASRMEIRVDLPAELFILRTSSIVLHCRNAAVGKHVGVSDDRRLGLAVRSWMLA